MTSLSEEMQSALRDELEQHDGCHEIALCLYLTVVASCYVTQTEFDEEVWESSRIFLLDEILQSCILKGALEVGGMNEDGEMTFQITDHGMKEMNREEENGW